MLDVGLDLLNLIVGLLRVVARDTDEFQLRESLYILQSNLPTQQLLKWLKTLIHSLVGSLTSATTLDKLVELILDEDTLQRCCVPSPIQLVELNLQLALEQPLGVVRRVAQDVANTHKDGLIIQNDTGIWRDRDLTVGEGIQRIDSLIRRLVLSNLNYNLNLLGRIIIDLLNLYLTLVVSLDNRLLDRLRRCGEWNLRNGKRALVNLRDARTNTDRASAKAIVIVRGIHNTSGLEVGQQHKLLATKVGNRGVDKLHKVVGQNL